MSVKFREVALLIHDGDTQVLQFSDSKRGRTNWAGPQQREQTLIPNRNAHILENHRGASRNAVAIRTLLDVFDW